MHKILVVDDDHDIRLLLSNFLKQKGYSVESAGDGKAALELLRGSNFDLVLCDYRLPDIDGLELLQRFKILRSDISVIIITGYSDVRTAVKTLKYGAVDYVVKPLYPDEILITIKDAIDKKSNKAQEMMESGSAQKAEPVPQQKKNFDNNEFVAGRSAVSEKVQRYVDLIAPSDMSVIVTGETGTGKEYVAKAIHTKSMRSSKPFIAIDCGALPKELAGSELFGHVKGAFTGALNDKPGSFELADKGTLFLDEIGNLTYENQIKLLRVLQEKKIKRIGGTKDISIDVRIIAATNDNLPKAIKEGKFREDLYHRINEFTIELSPLRERKPDIMVFANYFLEKANNSLNKSITGFSHEAVNKLTNYYWHGNLRELQNVVKRAVLLSPGNEIVVDSLPEEIVNPSIELEDLGLELPNAHSHTPDEKNMLKTISGNAERQLIIDMLERTGYNKKKAAELLKIDRKTLYNKLKAYEINL